jgi:hypothetical protein
MEYILEVAYVYFPVVHGNNLSLNRLGRFCDIVGGRGYYSQIRRQQKAVVLFNFIPSTLYIHSGVARRDTGNK